MELMDTVEPAIVELQDPRWTSTSSAERVRIRHQVFPVKLRLGGKSCRSIRFEQGYFREKKRLNSLRPSLYGGAGGSRPWGFLSNLSLPVPPTPFASP